MGFKTTYDNVIVKIADEESKTSSGIFITTSSTKTHNTGTVVYIGEGRKTTDGTLVPVSVKIGDNVIFGLTSGIKIRLDGEDLVVVKESDIIGIEDQ